jgi:hypothetical protein
MFDHKKHIVFHKIQGSFQIHNRPILLCASNLFVLASLCELNGI